MSSPMTKTPIWGIWFAGSRFSKPGLYFVTRRKAYRVLPLLRKRNKPMTDQVRESWVTYTASLEAELRGTEYALLQAEGVIETALTYGDVRAFDALRSYGLTSPAEGEQK